MTDGYVGNDMEIISEIQKHPNARVFGFGIGESVNRFLLDKMTEAGRGEVEYVGLNDDGSAAARRFYERIRNPLLTDISIDWNGLPVADVYPRRIPDLFSAKPLILSGRFTAAANGTIRLKGKVAGNDFVRDIPVSFPETMASHDVLSSLWARRRIDDLMSQDYAGAQSGQMKPDLKQTITQVGLEYRLMTQFTSFVAVEEMVVTDGNQPRRIDVPVEVPAGVNQAMVDSDQPRSSLFVGGLANRKSLGRGASAGIGGSGGGGRIAAPPPNMPMTVTVTADTGNSTPQATPAPVQLAQVMPFEISREKSKEERRQNELQLKIHPSVFAVVRRLQDKQFIPGPGEGSFIHDGKAEVQVWLTEKSEEAMAKLKELGFEVILDPKSSKLVIGRVAIEKLEALADLSFVRYVSPQVSK
jgi:Ca-activated chloride channel family protein